MNSTGSATDGREMPRLHFSVIALGCRLNQAESAGITRLMIEHGYTLAPVQSADVIIVNTCTVTHRADRDARKMVRRLHRDYPAAQLIVVGCLPERDAQAVSGLPGVALCAGNQTKSLLPQLIASGSLRAAPLSNTEPPQAALADLFHRLPPSPLPDHTRAWLKIQEGCAGCCTYCIVPRVRGKPRSMNLDQVERDVIDLRDQGVPEIVLSGIQLGAWGHDLSPPLALEDLLEHLLPRLHPARLRLSSLEISHASPRLLQMLAHPDLCPHLHIPIQHGDPHILTRMGRRQPLGVLLELFTSIRDQFPTCGLGTDVIVGFPGETDLHFSHAYKTIEQLPINHIHVFTYSPRPGTIAARWPDDVPQAEKANRARQLYKLVHDKKQRFAQAQIGRIADLVMLTAKPGLDNYRAIAENGSDAIVECPEARVCPLRWSAPLIGTAQTEPTLLVTQFPDQAQGFDHGQRMFNIETSFIGGSFKNCI